MNLKFKKGQVEIAGLGILVVVLVVILVIALTFMSKDTDVGTDVKSGLIANSLMNAIFKENKVMLNNLIYECYISRKANPKYECDKLTGELRKVFSYTLGKRKFEVSFSVDSSEFYRDGLCKTGIRGSDYRYKKEGTTLVGNIKLC